MPTTSFFRAGDRRRCRDPIFPSWPCRETGVLRTRTLRVRALSPLVRKPMGKKRGVQARATINSLGGRTTFTELSSFPHYLIQGCTYAVSVMAQAGIPLSRPLLHRLIPRRGERSSPPSGPSRGRQPLYAPPPVVPVAPPVLGGHGPGGPVLDRRPEAL